MIRAVIFDLDGVIRHFLPEHATEIELRHGLEIGSLNSAAFSQPLLTEVTSGRILRAEWVREIGRVLGAEAAAEEWGTLTPRPDPVILELADALRSRGMTVAILTNGTDTISGEVEAQGIQEHVDHVFNSAAIGFSKPDRRVFQHVVDALGIDGPQIFFTDDSLSNTCGAAELGFVTHHFAGVQPLREALNCAGVL